MKTTTTLILAAFASVFALVTTAHSGPGEKAPPKHLLTKDSSFSRSFHIGEKQLRVLVPAAFSAPAAEDPFAQVEAVGPAPRNGKFDPRAAAASAREVLISKYGVQIKSSDQVEFTFRDENNLMVTASPEVITMIGTALDGLLTPPQLQLKLHVYRLHKAHSLAQLFGEGHEGNAIDRQQLAAVKKKIIAAGGALESMPEIVATAGQRCKFEMIREHIYPTEYDPPELSKSEEAGAPIAATPANPTAFDVRNVGLTWEVEPIIEVGGTISLTGKVEDVQFLGNINYGSPIRAVASQEAKGEAVLLTENRILQPLFRVTRLPTNFSLPAAGGLIAMTGFTPLPAAATDELIEKEEKPAEGEEKAKVNPVREPTPRLFIIEAKLAKPK